MNHTFFLIDGYSLAFRDRMVEYGVTVSNRPVREAQLDLRVLGF